MGPTHFLRRSAVLAVGAAVLLSGCGRKGPLEPPPGVPQSGLPPAEVAARQQRILDDTDQPGLIQPPNYIYQRSAIAKLNARSQVQPPRPINAPPIAEPSTFLLDPLVK